MELRLRLPLWLSEALPGDDACFATDEQRMQFVVDLARRNIEHGTGGPFGAAVFETDNGRVVSIGVNLVEPSKCSLAHAEMVALALAQQTIGHYDLDSDKVMRELVTSTEPCAMCLGAIPWSGVRRVVCGARGQDACVIGFDEGAKPPNWIDTLQTRGIEVVRDVLRAEAQTVLQEYLKSGGPIYNGRRS
jgi:tRNA(Arg) A34 adenosine deaminase TadA